MITIDGDDGMVITKFKGTDGIKVIGTTTGDVHVDGTITVYVRTGGIVSSCGEITLIQ